MGNDKIYLHDIPMDKFLQYYDYLTHDKLKKHRDFINDNVKIENEGQKLGRGGYLTKQKNNLLDMITDIVLNTNYEFLSNVTVKSFTKDLLNKIRLYTEGTYQWTSSRVNSYADFIKLSKIKYYKNADNCSELVQIKQYKKEKIDIGLGNVVNEDNILKIYNSIIKDENINTLIVLENIQLKLKTIDNVEKTFNVNLSSNFISKVLSSIFSSVIDTNTDERVEFQSVKADLKENFDYKIIEQDTTGINDIYMAIFDGLNTNRYFILKCMEKIIYENNIYKLYKIDKKLSSVYEKYKDKFNDIIYDNENNLYKLSDSYVDVSNLLQYTETQNGEIIFAFCDEYEENILGILKNYNKYSYMNTELEIPSKIPSQEDINNIYFRLANYKTKNNKNDLINHFKKIKKQQNFAVIDDFFNSVIPNEEPTITISSLNKKNEDEIDMKKIFISYFASIYEKKIINDDLNNKNVYIEMFEKHYSHNLDFFDSLMKIEKNTDDYYIFNMGNKIIDGNLDKNDETNKNLFLYGMKTKLLDYDNEWM